MKTIIRSLYKMTHQKEIKALEEYIDMKESSEGKRLKELEITLREADAVRHTLQELRLW